MKKCEPETPSYLAVNHMLSQTILDRKLDLAAIEQQRERIAVRILRESAGLRDANFQTISTSDLFELYVHYDELFFDGEISKFFELSLIHI